MEQFAPQVLDGFAARVIVADRDVEDDPKLTRRLHVLGTPTFVLLDALGNEVGRFNYEATPDRLAERLTRLLARGG